MVKLLPITLLLILSTVTGCIVGYIEYTFKCTYDGGFVVGFLLPSLILYWLPKIKVPETKPSTPTQKNEQ